MSIIRIKSLHPETEYAPQWNIPLYQAEWNEFEKIDTIRHALLKNEQKFIDNLDVHQDGGTGLGLDSVTSRFGRYNLFDYIDMCPELAELLTFFRRTYVNFITEDTTVLRDLDIVCWFNVIRKGEKIQEHCHGSGHNSYLSGNFHADNYNTQTYYKSPFDPTLAAPFNNEKGVLTMFPSYLVHGTSEHTADDERVSIAFDLRLANNEHNEYLNAIPFMTREIFESL
tara:strand:+ start:621 stop:1298 length:678 start_codon:yes stop_codon:yes gene_type:complete